jgi:type IV secretory pathway TrbF-like protein
VRIFRKRSPAASARDAAETEPGPYRSRYDIAREGYDMRIAQLARALDQSSLKNYLSGTGNIVLAVGLVMIALRGGVRPIFIPYDQFGRVIHYDDLSRFKDPPRAMVESELGRWLVNVRGIYYGDPVAQLDRARAAKRLLAPEAEQWLDQYFSVPSRNPALLQRDLSRTVELVSISKDVDRPVWYLQWRELDVPVRGGYTESVWQGTLKVDFAPGRTEEAVWANPAGIRITSIEWNRIRERTSAPPTPAAPPPAAAPADPHPVSPSRPATGR